MSSHTVLLMTVMLLTSCKMWIQAIAIILPRVQQHFDGEHPHASMHLLALIVPLSYTVPDKYIGTLSSSMFGGMMFGAIGWGTCGSLCFVSSYQF